MEFAIAKKNTSKHDYYIRAHYNVIKRKWFAKYGKEEHPIARESLEISGMKILYSLPENTEHTPWTKREITRIIDPFVVSKYWSNLCEGIAIIGKPNRKEGTFIVTSILHDNIKNSDEETES